VFVDRFPVMEDAELITQLAAFASSLCQIIGVLPCLTCESGAGGDCSSSCTKCQLVSSRIDLARTIAELNQHLHRPESDTSRFIYVGSVVLCPRFYRGGMCWDEAIVTSIVVGDGTGTGAGSVPQVEMNLDAGTDVLLGVCWMRPHNVYESIASSILFSVAQILPPGDAVKHLVERENRQQQMLEGESVLALQRHSRTSAGLWLPATIVRFVSTDEVEVQYTAVGHSAARVGVVRTDDICLPPQSIRATLPSQCSEGIAALGAQSSHYDDASDSDTSVHSKHEGITTLPSYSRQHVSNCMQSSGSYGNFGTLSGSSNAGGSSANLSGVLNGAGGPSKVPVGQWEQHTKGVGSKIMKRMGYTM
jgi:hypothetical protein